MARKKYPVECLIKYDEADISTHRVTLNIFPYGTVEFAPRERDGRRIYLFDTVEAQQAALKKNPPGQQIFTIPTDIVDDDERQEIKEIVLEVLVEYRLLGTDLDEEPEPGKNRRGRPAARKV